MSVNLREEIARIHLEFAESRGDDKTYCPSEVARKFDSDNWRNQMDLVREVADELVESGKLTVLQKGKEIEEKPSHAKGPIRLRKS